MSVFGYSSPVNRRPFSFISDLDVRNSHVRLASTRQYRRLDQSHPKGAKQEHFLKTSDDKTTPTRSFSIRSTKRTFLSGISQESTMALLSWTQERSSLSRQLRDERDVLLERPLNCKDGDNIVTPSSSLSSNSQT